MAYTVHNFNKGDHLTAAALNEMDAQIKANQEKSGTGSIENLSIDTGKIANEAITADKLGTDSVTTEKIENQAVSSQKLSAGIQAQLNSTLTAMQQSVYDPQGKKTDMYKYVDDALSGFSADFKIKEVTSLPETGQEGTYYLLKKGNEYEKWWYVDVDGTGTKKWDKWGGAATLEVDALPKAGETGIDYILKTSDGLFIYRYIDNAWSKVAGTITKYIKNTETLPTEGDENIDYFVQQASGSWKHERYHDGAWIIVSGEADLLADTNFTTLQKKVTDNTSAINAVQSSVEGLSNVVSDVTTDATGKGTVTYQNGESKTVTFFDQNNVNAVSGISVSEDGGSYTVTHINGDTDTLAAIGGGSADIGSATITRITDAAISCIYGSSAEIKYTFTAKDSAGDIVGDGSATWSVGGVQRATSVAKQGDNSFDISPYLTAGSNTVKLSITVDTGGGNITTTKTWTVNAVNLYFEWEHDDSTVYTSAAVVRWTPYGDLQKTTHIIIDGDTANEITSITTRSGVPQSETIPVQSHGAHTVSIYVSAIVNGETITTVTQTHSFIFAADGNNTVIIGSSYTGGDATQYSTVAIPVTIYNPSSVTSNAILYVNDTQIGTWSNVDRTIHQWNYSPTAAGTYVLKIAVGDATKSWTINVTALDIDNSEVPDYAFRLKTSELTGNDGLRSWKSNDVTATFSDNFDWENGGLQSETDSNGNIRQYVCVKAGTTMTINYKPFESDCTKQGKNVKIMFRLANVRDYDAQWLSCYQAAANTNVNGIGIRGFAQEADFSSEQSKVAVPYYEDTPDPIELEFEVKPTTEHSEIIPWLDGVMAGVAVYPSNDAFVQTNPQNIVIGSADCDVYIYMIKVYESSLTTENHISNFIADAPNPQEMIDRYNRNDVLDDAGNIDYLKLVQHAPNLYVDVYDMPTFFTSNKKAKTSGNTFRRFEGSEDTQNPIITADGVQMCIQGTSSVGYYNACANFDDIFEGEIKDKNGDTLEGISTREDSMPVDRINNKVNEASAEGTNNALNQEWYNRFQPYIRPYRASNPQVRDTMEFAPGVAFFHVDALDDQTSQALPESFTTNGYHMYAIISTGTHKKDSKVFHDTANVGKECCVEVANNTSPECLMITKVTSDTFNKDKDDLFEFRYPDGNDAEGITEEMFQAWIDFQNWMADSNPNAATGETLSTPETYGSYTVKGIDEAQATNILKGTTVSKYAGTYTTDTFERRMAKMLSECEDHLVLDSLSYHYLFIERHTMIDNVAKNTFWTTHDLKHWYLNLDYDNDTADGNDNEGGLTLKYGYEAQDTIGTKNVFNAHEAVWFNFMDNLYDLNRVMYQNRESLGAWSATNYLKDFRDWQDQIPERVWNQDYWFKYLRRYEDNNDSAYLKMLEGGKKTYQRWQFEKYQEAYIASKYVGALATNDRITLRTYTPTTSGLVIAPKNEITLTPYAKMYLNILVGSISKQLKVDRGQSYTLNFDEAGSLNDTETYIYSASMVEAIGDLSHLYPGYMAFANATKLRSIQISSTKEGYTNTNATSLSFGNNKLLETLICPNLPNVTAALNLSGCQSLTSLDARGSGFTGFTFANGGLLQSAKLPAPASLSLRNLEDLNELTLEDYTALTSITIENCPKIDEETLLNNATNLVRIRLTNIDWTETGTEVSDLLARLYTLRGRDENDTDIADSVVTGKVHLVNGRQSLINQYKEKWPDLTIEYTTLIDQYTVTFKNWDGTILGTQFVDRGSTGYDPVQSGEMTTPTREATAQYKYTFSGWDHDFTVAVLSDITATAKYTEDIRKYTVTWHGANGVKLTSKEVNYGEEAAYEGAYPTKTDTESAYIYNIFTGWDKSTGRVTSDLDVNANFLEATLPTAGTDISTMNWAQLYGIIKSGNTASFVEIQDSYPITLGYEPEFSNVKSEVLAENVELTGATKVTTAVAPLSTDSSWVIMIDGVFDSNTSGQVMASCYTDLGLQGWKVGYSGGTQVQWGTQSVSNNKSTQLDSNNAGCISKQYRELTVLRHIQGETGLHVYMSQTPEDNIYVGTITKETSTASSNAIVFGCDNNSQHYSTGWLYKAHIWYDDLGDAECRKIAAWPRENINLLVKSVAGETQSDGTRSHIDFVADRPLMTFHRINLGSDITGGFTGTEMHSWMKSRIENALPIELQQIVATVQYSSVDYNGGSAKVVSSLDKVSIPSWNEWAGNGTNPYEYCGTQIPWMIADWKRWSIPGYLSTATSASIPNSKPTNPVKGDMWMDGYNSPELYNGHSWVQACYIWTRDAGTTQASIFVCSIQNGLTYAATDTSQENGIILRLSI